ncbi:hypothetical protein EVA_02438 [gut metagenome]|uniref:Uncharacterized protein n=1 Tax=gut metagenome TaxID=749906 RepID=J9H5Z6_9ZZZZ
MVRKHCCLTLPPTACCKVKTARVIKICTIKQEELFKYIK